jgi:hypothetical protein
METRRWLNPSQPQTLQIAVFLLYINSVLWALTGALFSGGILLVAGGVAGGYGIANERRWGYGLALATAFFSPVLRFYIDGLRGLFGVDIISLMFEIALIALLLHPQSREYQRIWFK